MVCHINLVGTSTQEGSHRDQKENQKFLSHYLLSQCFKESQAISSSCSNLNTSELNTNVGFISSNVTASLLMSMSETLKSRLSF